MADGIIQFRTEYVGSKINRYVVIPKMPDNSPLNRVIPFNVTTRSINIDTKERVGLTFSSCHKGCTGSVSFP